MSTGEEGGGRGRDSFIKVKQFQAARGVILTRGVLARSACTWYRLPPSKTDAQPPPFFLPSLPSILASPLRRSSTERPFLSMLRFASSPLSLPAPGKAKEILARNIPGARRERRCYCYGDAINLATSGYYDLNSRTYPPRVGNPPTSFNSTPWTVTVSNASRAAGSFWNLTF